MSKDILISGALCAGGVGTHASLLCGLLKASGAQVSVCSTKSEWLEAEVERLKSSGVAVYVPRHGKVEALITWPFLLGQRFDIVYCIGHGRAHKIANRFVRRGGRSIYHEVLVCPSRGGVMDKLMLGMGEVVANSQIVGAEMQERWPTKQISVIPFLTADAVCRVPAIRPPVGERELRVVYLGRLATHKRPAKLIEQWDRLCSLAPFGPARLDIFGDDSDRTILQRMRELVIERNLSNAVALHGSYGRGQVKEILANADLVVLPSEWEGLPLVLVEAMQHGVPVVATAVGGTRELGDNNPDVIITEPDWDKFVVGMVNMASKLRDGEIDSTRLCHWTESRYGFEVVAQKWRKCFGLA